MIKKFKTLNALSFKGSRVERGAIIEVEESDVSNIIDSLEIVIDEEVAVVDDKKESDDGQSLEDLSLADLKALAKEKNLPIGGSKSDLIERIQLSESED